jgi:putative nucleotidyltransferase with HDIG domain
MPEKNLSKFRRSKRVRLLVGLVTVISIVLMFPKGESIESEVSEGSIWIHNDLIAPFSFPIKKDPEIYKSEIKAAEQEVYPVFIKEENSVRRIMDSLENYNLFLLMTLDSSLSGRTNENLNPTFLTSETFSVFRNLRMQERNMVLTSITLNNLFKIISNQLNEIYKNGIININYQEIKRDTIAARTGNVDIIEPAKRFTLPDQAKSTLRNFIYRLNYSSEIKKALYEYGSHFIVPNVFYSERLTSQEIKQAQEDVSKYSGIVTENERIIAKHDRVTREAKLKIESYKEAKGEKIGEEGIFLQTIGKTLHISFLISLLTIYLYLFRKKIFFDNQKIILLAIIFIFLSFVTFLINFITVPAPMQFLIFVPAASMLITIIFDSRVGFYTTVILTLVTGALRGNDYTFAAMNLFAGALSVYTVRDIKNRSQIFRSFLFILLGYIITVLAFAFERFASTDSVIFELIFAASNSLISPVLTYGLLIFFEKFFNITTDLTLLELSNFDRPLLKELARKAPGTFNHSMTMGTIAESAAERVGANPLLTRVGAYYHDIGKLIMPQNFVENQLNNRNIHEDLTPEESVQLIIKHVNEGIQLAKENKIPQEIIDFIPMHHGTMTMTYFYEKAKKLYGEENVDIENYKYKGPKPESKETAIIMLADGSESAVRSIEDPDPLKVENIIENIIKNRIDDGQLDDSPLTFRDINKIKEAFISILLGQHHRRIRYPKQEEMEKGIEEDKS